MRARRATADTSTALPVLTNAEVHALMSEAAKSSFTYRSGSQCLRTARYRQGFGYYHFHPRIVAGEGERTVGTDMKVTRALAANIAPRVRGAQLGERAGFHRPVHKWRSGLHTIGLIDRLGSGSRGTEVNLAQLGQRIWQERRARWQSQAQQQQQNTPQGLSNYSALQCPYCGGPKTDADEDAFCAECERQLRGGR